jgi:hypothetical protein
MWLHAVALQVQQNQRDTAWASYTNTLGFSVMGIWPDGTDGTDINAVCRCASAGGCMHLLVVVCLGMLEVGMVKLMASSRWLQQMNASKYLIAKDAMLRNLTAADCGVHAVQVIQSACLGVD